MKRLLPYIALTLFLAQLLLMLLSWLLAAAFPMSGLRSLLSTEGLRWFMGHFSDLLATPLLVWLVLLSMAYGCFCESGLCRHLLTFRSSFSYRERRALMLVVLLLAVYVGVVLLLTAIPHAILLSATGELWPSPFSASLIPLIAFAVMLCSCAYGVIAGSFPKVHDVYESLLSGLYRGAPLLLLYVLLMQLYGSLRFVFPSLSVHSSNLFPPSTFHIPHSTFHII